MKSIQCSSMKLHAEERNGRKKVAADGGWMAEGSSQKKEQNHLVYDESHFSYYIVDVHRGIGMLEKTRQFTAVADVAESWKQKKVHRKKRNQNEKCLKTFGRNKNDFNLIFVSLFSLNSVSLFFIFLAFIFISNRFCKLLNIPFSFIFFSSLTPPLRPLRLDVRF